MHKRSVLSGSEAADHLGHLGVVGAAAKQNVFFCEGGVLLSARRNQRDLTRRRAMRFKYQATKRCLLAGGDLNLSLVGTTAETTVGPV